MLYSLANGGLGRVLVLFGSGLAHGGTLKTQGVDLPQDISGGMQRQMDLMENTFLPFLRLRLVFFHPPARRSRPHIRLGPIRFCLPSPSPCLTHTHLRNFPFVCFCGMFAFLRSLRGFFGEGGGHASKDLHILSFLNKEGNARA